MSAAFDVNKPHIIPQTNPVTRERNGVGLQMNHTAPPQAVAGNVIRNPRNEKEMAVNDKLKTFDLVQAVRSGKLPTNNQMTSFFQSMIDNPSIETRKHLMSEDGQLLLKDMRKLLVTLQKTLAHKNSDELFQSLVYHMSQSESPINKGARSMFTIGKIILLNEEFRDIMHEMMSIARDMFGDVSEKVADLSGKAGEQVENAGNQAQNMGNQAKSMSKKINQKTQEFTDQTREMNDPRKQDRVINNISNKVANPGGMTQSGIVNNSQNYTGRDPHEYEIRDNMRNQNFVDDIHRSSRTERRSSRSNFPPTSTYSRTDNTDALSSVRDMNRKGSITQQTPGYYQDHSSYQNQDIFERQTEFEGKPPIHTQNQTYGYDIRNPEMWSDSSHSSYEDRRESTDFYQNQNDSFEDYQPVNYQHEQGSQVQGINSGDQIYQAKSQMQDQGQQMKNQAKEQGQQIKSKVKNQSQQMKSQVQDGARQQAEDTKAYVHDKFPPEKQTELINRLKHVMHQVQREPDYQKAIDFIIYLFSTWGQNVVDATNSAANVASDATENMQSNSNWSNAALEIKAIFEDWAQGQSLDPLLESIQTLFYDIKNDPKLHGYYEDVIGYLKRLLKDPGYVDSEASTKDGEKLLRTGQKVTKGRYQNLFYDMLDESKEITQAMAEDPVALEINKRLRNIHKDLWLDGEGNPAFKPQLLTDMRKTLLPAILEQIKFVPIPRIEYSDPQFDVVVENVVLSGDTMLPNVFDIKMENFSRFSPKTNVSNVDRQSIFIDMKEIQAVVEDVVFYYKKKTGFPKLSDRGVASLVMGGKGISAAVRVTSNSLNPRNTFKVTYCKCTVDDLKLNIKDSRHGLLYKTVHPMVIGIVRRQIAKALEAKIIDFVEQGDREVTSKLYRTQRKMDEKQTYLDRIRQPGASNLTARQQPTTAAQTGLQNPLTSEGRQRPGLFTTLVDLMNYRFKAKISDTLTDPNRTSDADSIASSLAAEPTRVAVRSYEPTRQTNRLAGTAEVRV
ncbi:hypothetical protein CLU79DRAFT_716995 [Phycomyces nitens]|nr:hypothetical protein CLU79DRAFT_716995 [Phycomyces nitens]